jgi:hypothetical protein
MIYEHIMNWELGNHAIHGLGWQNGTGNLGIIWSIPEFL